MPEALSKEAALKKLRAELEAIGTELVSLQRDTKEALEKEREEEIKNSLASLEV